MGIAAALGVQSKHTPRRKAISVPIMGIFLGKASQTDPVPLFGFVKRSAPHGCVVLNHPLSAETKSTVCKTSAGMFSHKVQTG